MTFERILYNLSNGNMSPKEAYDEISEKEKMKKINYYCHFNDSSKEPMRDTQLQELSAIVGILQILYNSEVDSPVSDYNYDSLQEILVNMGIPRLTGSIELNSSNKVNHQYTQLRGTLDKVYYLILDEKRTNKSRKYLDEWIKSAEALYFKNTGKTIDLNKEKIMLQCKFDGASSILEVDNKHRWITRGDTRNNLASDVSHILNIFDDLYQEEKGTGIKFEIMMTEENKDRINDFYREHPYHNSRQIVTATLNSNEADFKAEYLYPVPLRIIHDNEKVESIHPDLIKNFPTEICTFGDRETIRNFANHNRYAIHNGMRFRTDGVVMTILNPEVCIALGRDNNINNFEVAYKFTEEAAYTKVKDIEFYTSNFGYITPVLVVNDVILKGNTVNRISLSNKERFDELDFSYGDDVKVLYDIIPYATIDDNCKRMKNGRKIQFITKCPKCKAPLDLNVVQVRCTNPNCPSRVIGRMLNYCSTLRIQNIGYQTLDMLYFMGYLDQGILSLYKLRKHSSDIQNIDGFGIAKTKKIIKEIEAKRKLNDFDFFGALGIDNCSVKTFQEIFSNIKLEDFLNMIKLNNIKLLNTRLLAVNGVGEKTANLLSEYFNNKDNVKELKHLLKEITLVETYGGNLNNKGRICFSGIRPSLELGDQLRSLGWNPSDSWSDKDTKYLVVPFDGFSSSKVEKAMNKNIPIVTLELLKDILKI